MYRPTNCKTKKKKYVNKKSIKNGNISFMFFFNIILRIVQTHTNTNTTNDE